MKESSKTRELMISVLYGEADSAAQSRLEEALKADPALAQEYQQLQETIETVSGIRLVEDPGSDFWEGVWPEFKRRMHRVEEEQKRPSRGFVGLRWRPALQLALICVMLVVGILIGRFLGGQESAPVAPPSEEPTFVETPISTVAFPYEREIEQEKQDYILDATRNSLQRSEDVLKSFLELEPQSWDSQMQVFDRNRSVSRELLDEFSTIRIGIGGTAVGNLESLLDEIEVVISDIAIIEAGQKDVWFEIRDLQKGITDRDLLNRLKQIEFTFSSVGSFRDRVER